VIILVDQTAGHQDAWAMGPSGDSNHSWVTMLSNGYLAAYRPEVEAFSKSFRELQTNHFYTNEELSIHSSELQSRPEFNLRTQ